MEQDRDFKGVWISRSVYLDARLTALEKIVLVEIDSLDGKDGCYCSNNYLADFCQCSERKISAAITKLEKLGYIYVESFDGRRRVLRSRLEKSARQDSSLCEADGDIPIINNNNKGNNKTNNASKQKEIDEMFERVWKLYPKKEGKHRVSKESKRKLYDAGEDTIVKAVENYKSKIEKDKTADKYIKHGSTFFNGDWQDFVGEPEQEIPEGYVLDKYGELMKMPIGRLLTPEECERLGRNY